MEGDPTSSFYARNAAAYAASSSAPNTARLDKFLAMLSPGATILELGCGNGRDSAAMIERGFSVIPTDGTPELAREAELRLGLPVRVLNFADIDFVSAFDGIWANACLLHVPREKLSGILAKIHASLRPEGVFYASYKAGQAEGHDSLGRYYNYPSEDWLSGVYAQHAWASVEIQQNRGGGYDNLPTDWLHVLSIKT